MQNLVIVESPTKSRTLSKFLGSKYRVEASMGHIRDLPKSELGVDVSANFEPKYIVPRDKIKLVNELKRIASEATTLFLATDPDREGEAIAWHIKELLVGSRVLGDKDKKQSRRTPRFAKRANAERRTIRRVVFHEITPKAVKEAFDNPREINIDLVDAQQARRILDRLVGYKLSPLLWKKIKSGLSAGRVQTVALRLIVEKETEIVAFKPIEYWSIEAELRSKINSTEIFRANLVELNEKKLEIKNQAEAETHLEQLKKADFVIDTVETKEVRRYPAPPFTTSTLQQAANLKLGMTAKKTMMVAQALYEHGLITYMRTDSFNLAEEALSEIRGYISQNLGSAYLPNQPKFYKAKSKLVQEAHEAIRPTNIKVKSDELRMINGMTREHTRLYDLIWKRSLACQVNEALLDQTTIDVSADKYLFRATGSVVKFDGWLKIYGYRGESGVGSREMRKSENDGAEEDGKTEQTLPKLTEGEALDLLQLLPGQHFTEAPARFNEASLIKKLEELGIGRPSTYAPILSTIQERFYVERKDRKFFPTELGKAVAGFLLEYFPDLFDYSFTAAMEDQLDEIAEGLRPWKSVLAEFYAPFEKTVEETTEKAGRVQIITESTDKKCSDCGKDLVIKFGRFGKFLACSGFPDCKHTEGLEEKVGVKCPDCGGDILIRKTHKGRPFFGCQNWPSCKFASWTKPKS